MNPTLERCLGRLLRRVRAGDARLAWNAAGLRDAPAGIALTSPAFADGGAMPQLCAGEGVGDNLSPPLAWSGLPDGTKELVLIVEDPDAPLRRPAVHLIAAGIAPDRAGVPEGALTPPRTRRSASAAACSGGSAMPGRARCWATDPIATSSRSMRWPRRSRPWTRRTLMRWSAAWRTSCWPAGG